MSTLCREKRLRSYSFGGSLSVLIYRYYNLSVFPTIKSIFRYNSKIMYSINKLCPTFYLYLCYLKNAILRKIISVWTFPIFSSSLRYYSFLLNFVRWELSVVLCAMCCCRAFIIICTDKFIFETYRELLAFVRNLIEDSVFFTCQECFDTYYIVNDFNWKDVEIEYIQMLNVSNYSELLKKKKEKCI